MFGLVDRFGQPLTTVTTDATVPTIAHNTVEIKARPAAAPGPNAALSVDELFDGADLVYKWLKSHEDMGPSHRGQIGKGTMLAQYAARYPAVLVNAKTTGSQLYVGPVLSGMPAGAPRSASRRVGTTHFTYAIGNDGTMAVGHWYMPSDTQTGMPRKDALAFVRGLVALSDGKVPHNDVKGDTIEEPAINAGVRVEVEKAMRKAGARR